MNKIKKELELAKKELDERKTVFSEISVIKTEGEADIVSSELKKSKDFLKLIESKRKDITKPLLDSKKEIDRFFKKMSEPVKEQHDKQVVCIANWQEKIEKEQEKERMKIIEKEEQERKRIESLKLSDDKKEERKNELERKMNLEKVGLDQATQTRAGVTVKTRKSVEVKDVIKVMCALTDAYREGKVNEIEINAIVSITATPLMSIIERGVEIGGASVVNKKIVSG